MYKVLFNKILSNCLLLILIYFLYKMQFLTIGEGVLCSLIIWGSLLCLLQLVSECCCKNGFMKLLSNIHHTLFVYNPVASVPINKGLVTNKTLFFSLQVSNSREKRCWHFKSHVVWHLVLSFILMCGCLVKSRPPSWTDEVWGHQK